MGEGWVKLHRQSIENGWLKNHKLWTFWTYCLMKATRKKYKAKIGYQEISLLPGQFIFGRKTASEETGLSERSIRTSVDFLRKAGNMTSKTTNKFSIVTICNWTTYQSVESENDQQNDQPPTSKRPASDHIQEDKRKEVKDKNICAFDFEEIWKLYPNKIGKSKALLSFKKSVKSEQDVSDIKTALKNYKNHLEKNNWKKPQDGSTWFNNWKDWIDFEEPKKEETEQRRSVTMVPGL